MKAGASQNQIKKPKPAPKPSQAGASTHSIGVDGKFSAYFRHHRTVGLETLQNLLSTWLTSLMTWLVIGIALALPAILYVLLSNLGEVGGAWHGSPKISLYLQSNVSVQAGQRLGQKLAKRDGVKQAIYISAADALLEFQSQSGFGDVLSSLPNNPLPAVVIVEPSRLSGADIQLQLAKLSDLPEVASVSADLAWLERLFALLLLAQRFVVALSLILGLGVLLAIGNTIRLAIESRRAEIEVVKLVGGTNSFVRRPFLYLGFWYGLGGALIAWLMLQFSLLFLSGPVEMLMTAYQNSFSLVGLNLFESLFLILFGTVLGVLGAVLAVGRHLHLIEPK